MSTHERRILVIGIGAGDPDHLTLGAVKAIRRADVFFIVGKGPDKAALTDVRRRMVEEHTEGPHRVVEVEDPSRERRSMDRGAYTDAVRDWRERRGELFERLMREEMTAQETGAFLVWGDPSLYDSTLGILADIEARGSVRPHIEVVPGITSVSTLAARHRIPLNQVGRPVHITPARRLSDVARNDDGDIVVMLDAHESFTQVEGDDVWIYWGAYLGTPDELLVAGPVREVADRIRQLRAAARERHGWIMDTYLLRRGAGTPRPGPSA
ncbi:precorrin-6A synthase (deacetylating) [Streptomyces sp. NBC_00083]|uniref:precorrin-6A synthase (deacetylating) n=1 Tax=Streptomyces sp. NBC_00083 TaxID=2975647 RepID=UPI002250B0FF|nr:precorrin-6A synthase (deacetylating) [Streptomyces sp. NBC_00083]MCX5384157.1 precorrin-6A synthase (deacetylating) [Streptomyces sp. NBC_00083]